jgi:hypothetical protein
MSQMRRRTCADCWHHLLQGYALYDCNAEFRLFWVASKLAETDAAQSGSNHNRYSIVALPAYHATPGMLLWRRVTTRADRQGSQQDCVLQPVSQLTACCSAQSELLQSEW